MHPPSRIGDRLRLLMVERFGTATAFSRALGVQSTQVSSWLSGTTGITLRSLETIATATNVSVDWLIFGGEDGPIYRSQSRTRATLEADLAALVAREISKELADKSDIQLAAEEIEVDSDAAIAETVARGVRNLLWLLTERSRRQDASRIVEVLRRDLTTLASSIPSDMAPQIRRQLGITLAARVSDLYRLEGYFEPRTNSAPVSLAFPFNADALAGNDTESIAGLAANLMNALRDIFPAKRSTTVSAPKRSLGKASKRKPRHKQKS